MRPPARFGPPARVKRCGKSAPRAQRWARHGKPHREQDRIGTACLPRGRQGVFRAAVRVGCLRRDASRALEEWPSPRATAVQNPAYRPSGALFSFFVAFVQTLALPAEISARMSLVASTKVEQKKLNACSLIVLALVFAG